MTAMQMKERKQKEKKRIKEQKKILHERNYTKHGLDLNVTVTLMSAATLLIFSLYALINIDTAAAQMDSFKDAILTNFDGMLIFTTNFFIILLMVLAICKKSAKVKIGGKDAQKEFSNFAWYSMLMSAGMGIGLVFWSVGEPLYHQEYSPLFASGNAEITGLATTFFHWTIHPWAVYSVIALAFGYFAYNKNLPLSPRSFLYPILKDKIFGFWGDIVDTLAVLAALAGLATSLGLGVQQVNSGLNYIFGIPFNTTIQVILIAIITFIATLSVVTGIDRGVRILSELNVKAAGILMLIVFLIGPTFLIIKNILLATGVFIVGLPEASLTAHVNDPEWAKSWTLFYWAWWISWSPFVGMFIAKISKGRTVREFVIATVAIPSLASIVWLGVFGTTAMQTNIEQGGQLLADVKVNLSSSLFEMISMQGLGDVITIALQVFALLLIISFFVTSSDSGSLVVDSLASGGKIKTPVPQRIFWAVMEGVVAGILLIIGGTEVLGVLETAVVTTGLPFAIIITIASFTLIKELLFYKEEVTQVNKENVENKENKENSENKENVETMENKEVIENKETKEN